jgi:hypothetical protein
MIKENIIMGTSIYLATVLGWFYGHNRVFFNVSSTCCEACYRGYIRTSRNVILDGLYQHATGLDIDFNAQYLMLIWH